jgi:hypothetical protein
MGKTKDSINFFGEKGKGGINTVKLAGQAITAAICLTAVGVAVGVANHMFGGGK